MSEVGNRLIEAAKQASAIARGEMEPSRLHVPPEIDVKAIRTKLDLTQEGFANQFGFSVNQIREWEQARCRPIGGVRAYLMLIQADHERVLQMLLLASKDATNIGDTKVA